MGRSTIPVAVTSRSFSRDEELRALLLERYENVTFNDRGLSLEGDALIAFLRGHSKAITALERLDAGVFAALPELKVIGKYGVGLDMIDLEAMTRHGVKLGWTRGVNRRSVAELTLSFMIALLRHVPAATNAVRAGAWRQIVGRQLTGRTVGIVGCGSVGQDLVRLLTPFRCRVLAYDIRRYDAFCSEFGVETADLDTLLRVADVVTLHVPLDAGTRGILSADRLALMKPEAVLINTARGSLIDEMALKAMLRDGRLAGAALDVLATEPPDDPDLLALPNVLVTPHIGGSAREAILAMGLAAIDGLDNAGNPLMVANAY